MPTSKPILVAYRTSIRCALFWFAALVLLCVGMFDGGVGLKILLCTLVVFGVMGGMIIPRRPTSPSRVDLLLIGWALPILFFALYFLRQILLEQPI